MSIELPPPISLYLKIENSGDVASLPQCFAANATVRDERHVYQGLPAIKEWLAETKKKYNHAIEPISIADQDGKKVVTATTGTFPAVRDAQIQLCSGGRQDRISTDWPRGSLITSVLSALPPWPPTLQHQSGLEPNPQTA
jgi:hypothetical protein